MQALHAVARQLPRRVVMMLVVLGTSAANAADTRVFAGAPVAVGNGSARVITVAAADDTPASVSVVLTGEALEGLPQAGGGHSVHEYVLPMPAGGPRTGYRHVTLDWNPAGHIPDGVYSVAHFDVHFYLVDRAEQQAITYRGPDRERLLAAPDASLVPAGYVVPPDTAVERMGLHGVDPGWAEFQGRPFTHSFLYGYHDGRLIFVEPMVALDWLRTRADVTVPVKTPARYSLPGHYPTRYRVGYDAERDEYRVALVGLRGHGGDGVVAR